MSEKTMKNAKETEKVQGGKKTTISGNNLRDGTTAISVKTFKMEIHMEKQEKHFKRLLNSERDSIFKLA